MQTNRRLAVNAVLVAGLLASLLFAGTAPAQGQLTVCAGKFTLPYQVRWASSTLPPGDYTLTIQSTGFPITATIRTAEGKPIINVVSRSFSERTNGKNALLIGDRDGQLVVHSLALAELRKVLVFDPALAREAVKEALVNHTVPVVYAKK